MARQPLRDQTPLNNFPPLAVCLVVLNVAAFTAVVELCGPSDVCLYRVGAQFNPAVVDGEFWRMLMAPLLHRDLAHLITNCLVLLFFGRAVEAAYGHSRFLLIYVAGALLGSLVTLALSAPVTQTVGASGAIFAVILHSARLVKPLPK